MSMKNIVKLSNGEILTGKLWRLDHPLFLELPFYSNIVRMAEIEGPLQKALGEVSGDGGYIALLVVSPLRNLPFY
jgi:hypothetical protein